MKQAGSDLTGKQVRSTMMHHQEQQRMLKKTSFQVRRCYAKKTQTYEGRNQIRRELKQE